MKLCVVSAGAETLPEIARRFSLPLTSVDAKWPWPSAYSWCLPVFDGPAVGSHSSFETVQVTMPTFQRRERIAEIQGNLPIRCTMKHLEVAMSPTA
jgi:hypothetical protein